VLAYLSVAASDGCASASVRERRERFGANTFPERPGRSFLSFLWDALQDRMLLCLMVAAALDLAGGLLKDAAHGWHDGAALLVTITVCALLSSYNDYEQSLQFQSLNREKRDIQVTVLRDRRRCKLSLYELVVGDVADTATCLSVTQGASFVLHLAAFSRVAPSLSGRFLCCEDF
jgi:Ca2+-transporting ATPase